MLFSSSHKQSNTHTHLTNYLFKYIKLSYFFKMRPGEENYTAEEPSDSSFLTKIFSNCGQTDFCPNQLRNTILNFSQCVYYPNCPYDISIYPHQYPSVYSNNIIYHNRTQQCNHVKPIIFLAVVVVVVLINNRMLKITAVI
jgi:hypothetical protein